MSFREGRLEKIREAMAALQAQAQAAAGNERSGVPVRSPASCPPPAPRGLIPGHLSAKERMRRKLQTKGGGKRYALRMETVAPVSGQSQQARGLRRFLLPGLQQVQGEWPLICTGHNLLKLFRRPMPVSPPPSIPQSA